MRDAGTIIKNAKADGWNGHGVIIDLPRSVENDAKRLYAYIEAIKNGMITATKYSGGTSIFPIGYMIVFANWMPKIKCLSIDRWDIRLMEKNKEGEVEVTLHNPLENQRVGPSNEYLENFNKKMVKKYGSI